MEMLKRLEEGDDSLLAECCDDEGLESADASTLEERLAGLDLGILHMQYDVPNLFLYALLLDKDEDRVWERLTASEKKEFHRMARGGALSQLLPESQLPWWKVSGWAHTSFGVAAFFSPYVLQWVSGCGFVSRLCDFFCWYS